MADYKIQLGVQVNTAEIRTQISKFQNNNLGKLKLSIDKKNVNTQLNSIRKQIQNLSNIKIKLNFGGTGVGVGSSSASSEVNKLKKDYKELLTMSKRINNLEFKIGGFKIAGGHKNEIELLEKQLESLRFEYDKLVTTFNQDGGFNSDIFDVNDFQKLNHAIDESEAKITDLKADFAEKIKLNIDTDIAKNISKVHSDFDKLSNKSAQLKEQLDKLDSIKVDLDTAKANNDIDGLINANKEYERVLKEVQAQLDINARAEKGVLGGEILENKKIGLMADMNKWLKDNSAAADQFGDKLKELPVQLSRCTTEADFKKV